MNEPLDLSIRRWGAACHLTGLLAILVCSFAPIPFLGALFPYIAWRLGRDRHPFIDEQGRAAINFQLSMSIYLLVAVVLWLFLAFTTCMIAVSGAASVQTLFGSILSWTMILGIAAIVVFAIFMLSVIIFAALKADRGQSYRYPFSLHFLQ